YLRDELPAARAALERATAIREKTEGNEHPDVASDYRRMGEMFVAEKQYDRALAALERALAIADKAYAGGDHRELAEDLDKYAEALLGAGRAAQALKGIERSAAMRERLGSEPRDRAVSLYILARATWDSGGDRAHALVLARRGQAMLASLAYSPEKTEVDAWIDAHAGRVSSSKPR